MGKEYDTIICIKACLICYFQTLAYIMVKMMACALRLGYDFTQAMAFLQ